MKLWKIETMKPAGEPTGTRLSLGLFPAAGWELRVLSVGWERANTWCRLTVGLPRLMTGSVDLSLGKLSVSWWEAQEDRGVELRGLGARLVVSRARRLEHGRPVLTVVAKPEPEPMEEAA